MTTTPRVSVLMTTYNGARFLAESIDSVLAQNYADFELVVVDDASTDVTRSILARYADRRLRVIHNASNLGVVGARNRGFAELRGRYVATIDHDDLWLQSRLAAGVAVLDNDPAMLLVASQTLDLVDGRRTVSDRPAAPNATIFRWMLLMDCAVVYSSLLFRREAAQLSDGTFLRPALRYADDYELMNRLAWMGSATVLPEPLTVYRAHSGNTTHQVIDEMDHNAVTVRAEQLERWFGTEAREAAALLARYIGRRQPVMDAAMLRQLGAILRRMISAFVAEQDVDARDREYIQRYTQQIYWRAVRAGIRIGRIELLRAAVREGALPFPAFGGLNDVAASLAVGALRFLFRR